ADTAGIRRSDGREWWSFGATAQRRWMIQNALNEYLGIKLPRMQPTAYPVRVRFGKNRRVDRIERGDEVEELPLR
ncbi:MAG: hypothetical protein U0992_25360, partial [Planctomycetaceae bacterium]